MGDTATLDKQSVLDAVVMDRIAELEASKPARWVIELKRKLFLSTSPDNTFDATQLQLRLLHAHSAYPVLSAIKCGAQNRLYMAKKRPVRTDYPNYLITWSSNGVSFPDERIIQSEHEAWEAIRDWSESFYLEEVIGVDSNTKTSADLTHHFGEPAPDSAENRADATRSERLAEAA